MKKGADIDVAELPEFAFGSRAVTWWSVINFLVIEGTIFGLCLITYFYLRDRVTDWPPPPTPLPGLLVPTVNLVIILSSLVPMYLLDKAARRLDARTVLICLVVCDLLGLTFCVLRIFEFGALNVYWDTNAYGSIVWTILGFHTFHLVAEVVETIVITLIILRRHTQPKYMVDASDNALYWYFITGIWVPCYVVLYLAPRFL